VRHPVAGPPGGQVVGEQEDGQACSEAENDPCEDAHDDSLVSDVRAVVPRDGYRRKRFASAIATWLLGAARDRAGLGYPAA
jgi:hypothetical protein